MWIGLILTSFRLQSQMIFQRLRFPPKKGSRRIKDPIEVEGRKFSYWPWNSKTTSILNFLRQRKPLRTPALWVRWASWAVRLKRFKKHVPNAPPVVLKLEIRNVVEHRRQSLIRTVCAVAHPRINRQVCQLPHPTHQQPGLFKPVSSLSDWPPKTHFRLIQLWIHSNRIQNADDHPTVLNRDF